MDYWKECIEEAFEDAGIIATKEQTDTVISWVDGAHENYSMFTGEGCIPDPMLVEVETLKLEKKKLEERHSIQISGIKKGFANRRKVSEQDVHIEEDGHVIFDRR